MKIQKTSFFYFALFLYLIVNVRVSQMLNSPSRIRCSSVCIASEVSVTAIAAHSALSIPIMIKSKIWQFANAILFTAQGVPFIHLLNVIVTETSSIVDKIQTIEIAYSFYLFRTVAIPPKQSHCSTLSTILGTSFNQNCKICERHSKEPFTSNVEHTFHHIMTIYNTV